MHKILYYIICVKKLLPVVRNEEPGIIGDKSAPKMKMLSEESRINNLESDQRIGNLLAKCNGSAGSGCRNQENLRILKGFLSPN